MCELLYANDQYMNAKKNIYYDITTGGLIYLTLIYKQTPRSLSNIVFEHKNK